MVNYFVIFPKMILYGHFIQTIIDKYWYKNQERFDNNFRGIIFINYTVFSFIYSFSANSQIASLKILITVDLEENDLPTTINPCLT